MVLLQRLPKEDQSGILKRGDPSRMRRGPIGLAVVALIGDGDARVDILADGQRRLELRAVARLATGQNTPDRLSRQNRFHMLFQLPSSLGKARQVMLCTVNQCKASQNVRSPCLGSPRLDWTASNTSSTIDQSRAVIPVGMSGCLAGHAVIRHQPVRESVKNA
jgi:hypothetical protein